MRYVVLDTETTGLNVDDGHRVIEIGCVEIENRSLTGREYHQKINPVREVDKGAEEIHGMNAAQLKIYPKFEGIVEEFIEFIKAFTDSACPLFCFNNEIFLKSFHPYPFKFLKLLSCKIFPSQKTSTLSF